MNEKSCLNEAKFVFAIQSCFWKNLNFLTQVHKSRPKHVDLTTMPYPSALGMATMLDLKNNKQRGQLCTLVVRREKKIKNTNNRSSTTIQPLSIYTRHIIWNRARLRIQLNAGWPDLTTEKRHTRLLNGAGAAHLLGREEHTPIAFRLKNNKYTMKLLKHPHSPLNYTKYPCKATKNTPKGKVSFLFFLRLNALFDYTWKLKKPGYPYGKKPKKCLSTRKKMRN